MKIRIENNLLEKSKIQQKILLLSEGVKLSCIVLVKKINKNPKIRIKLIYFYFEFSNKLFSMRIFIFLVFFFAFFYALKSVFNGDFIFSNFSFTKKMISTVFLIFFQYFGPIKIPRQVGDIFFYFIFLTKTIPESLTPS